MMSRPPSSLACTMPTSSHLFPQLLCVSPESGLIQQLKHFHCLFYGIGDWTQGLVYAFPALQSHPLKCKLDNICALCKPLQGLHFTLRIKPVNLPGPWNSLWPGVISNVLSDTCPTPALYHCPTVSTTPPFLCLLPHVFCLMSSAPCSQSSHCDVSYIVTPDEVTSPTPAGYLALLFCLLITYFSTREFQKGRAPVSCPTLFPLNLDSDGHPASPGYSWSVTRMIFWLSWIDFLSNSIIWDHLHSQCFFLRNKHPTSLSSHPAT